MLLHAAIHPPSRVLDPVAEVVRSAGVARSAGSPTPADALPARRGFLGRGGRRGSAPTSQPRVKAVTPRAVREELDLVAPAAMSLPICGFGNVTSGDAVRLAKALQTAALGSPGATLWIAGGTALEFPEDRNVWARLEGDLDALKSMARGVTQIVEQLGFFVDRRKFRPWLAVASVTAATTPSVLEAVVAALDSYKGEPWSVDHVSLMKASYSSSSIASEFEEVDRFPLASP